MTDNKKSGIRLRHFQQIHDQKFRDTSPGGNRRKIFEKKPQPKAVRAEPQHQGRANRQPSHSPEKQSAEFQKLVDNLKRKTMEVELRDNMIRTLNREIDELKKQIANKDQQISRLQQNLLALQKDKVTPNIDHKAENTVFDSFRDPSGPFANLAQVMPEHYSFKSQNYPPALLAAGLRVGTGFEQQKEIKAKSQDEFSGNFRKNSGEGLGLRKESDGEGFRGDSSSEVAVQNYTDGFRRKKDQFGINKVEKNQHKEKQPEILSPFMALTNNKRIEPPSQPSISVYEPNQKMQSQSFYANTQRSETQPQFSRTFQSPFESYTAPPLISATHSSAFARKQGEFELGRDKKPAANAALQKFNIFGDGNNNNSRDYTGGQRRQFNAVSEYRDFVPSFQVRDYRPSHNDSFKPGSKLEIEDSAEFRFEDFSHNDF